MSPLSSRAKRLNTARQRERDPVRRRLDKGRQTGSKLRMRPFSRFISMRLLEQPLIERLGRARSHAQAAERAGGARTAQLSRPAGLRTYSWQKLLKNRSPNSISSAPFQQQQQQQPHPTSQTNSNPNRLNKLQPTRPINYSLDLLPAASLYHPLASPAHLRRKRKRTWIDKRRKSRV